MNAANFSPMAGLKRSMKSNVAIKGIQRLRNTNIQKPKSIYMKITIIPILISLKFEPKVMHAAQMHKKK